MVLAPNVASVMFIITQCVHQGLDIAWRYFLFIYLYYFLIYIMVHLHVTMFGLFMEEKQQA
jgi:hypothetical protein